MNLLLVFIGGYIFICLSCVVFIVLVVVLVVVLLLFYFSGPSCSKLMMSLLNVSLKL